jgi:hypothetical protein
VEDASTDWTGANRGAARETDPELEQAELWRPAP